MVYQIVTVTITDAFVGVPYEDFVVSSGEYIDPNLPAGEYVWTLKGVPSWEEYKIENELVGDTPTDTYYALTGLTRGLLWTPNGNTVTINGTPVDDFNDSSGIKYPAKRVKLEFLVTYNTYNEGALINTETASRDVSMRVNRVIDDNTANIFLDNFKEPDELIREDLFLGIVDGIPDNDERTAIINSLAKRVSTLNMVYTQDGTYQTYFQLLWDEVPATISDELENSLN